MNRSAGFSFTLLTGLLLGIHCSGDKKGAPTAATTADTAARYSPPAGTVDFVSAARAVTPGVVHVKTVYQEAAAGMYPPDLFGDPEASISTGSGSGVTLTSDGYIATNNHVVEGASSIEVVFPDRRVFPARLVGRDPNTDLALLKVDAKNLPSVRLGNSDRVQVGEWVLAVGYPYSLNTTVTAGIVSAKGRSIGIINQPGSDPYAPQDPVNTGIESFIQTDAAINPGNSGGALVNGAGELIGINTAIASMTGSYAGYAFAIPVNLAKKILDDLRQYRTVQRGILGVTFPAPSVEDNYLRQLGIDPAKVKGVLITGIQSGSAAAAAGLREGDIILSIDGARISSSAEFSERIARQRPGDQLALTYQRDGKEHTATVKLKGEEAVQQQASNQSLKDIYERLGAIFAPLTEALRERYNVKAGVLVKDVFPGGFFDQLGIPPGTTIMQINGRAVYTPRDIDKALVEAQNSRVQILAVAPDGSRVAFVFSLGT